MLTEVAGHIQFLAAVGLMPHFLSGEDPLLLEDSCDEVWPTWLIDIHFLEGTRQLCHLAQPQLGSEIRPIPSGRGNSHVGMYTGWESWGPRILPATI